MSESNPNKDYPIELDGPIASHEDVKREKERKRELRKWLVISLSDGSQAPYQYRALTESERDTIAQENTKIRKKRGETVEDIDLPGFRTDVIKTCVTDGPPGYKNTEREIKSMDDDVRQELADAITEFSTMEETEYLDF